MAGKKRLVAMLCICLAVMGGCVPSQGLAENSPAPWTYPLSIEELRSDYIRLVNRESLLPSDYIPEDLVKIKAKKTSSSAIQMRQQVSDALDEMFAAALADGVTLYAHSGYRSYKTQNTMYYNRLERNNGKDDGAVAYPGASDHQTGLGIDVISKAWIGKRFNEDFAKTKEAQWMAEHCPDYGFIIRYPKGKEDITQIMYEPWHLRYVGVTAARYITQGGLTLEEFTLEWQAALAAYQAGGGSVEQSLSVYGPSGSVDLPSDPYETGDSLPPDPVENQPPAGPQILEEVGEDGDREVTLFH